MQLNPYKKSSIKVAGSATHNRSASWHIHCLEQLWLRTKLLQQWLKPARNLITRKGLNLALSKGNLTINKGFDMYRVLVVDDDEDHLFIIGEYLELNGVQFDLAQSAARARKCLSHGEYDLVISDFQMPGESGLDLFRSVSFRYPGLPFVLMSGNQDPRLRREAISMGVCKFLEKPFELSHLKRLITGQDRCVIRPGIGAPAA